MLVRVIGGVTVRTISFCFIDRESIGSPLFLLIFSLSSLMLTISGFIIMALGISCRGLGSRDFDNDRSETAVEHFFPHLGQYCQELDSIGVWHDVQLLPMLLIP